MNKSENTLVGAVNDLPKNWLWVELNDISSQEKNAIVDGPFGSNLKVSDYVTDGPIRVLTTKNLEGDYENVRFISLEKFEELRRSEVRPGDILMAKIGSCGKTGIYPNNMPPAIIPANLLKITVNKNINSKYVYYYFDSLQFKVHLSKITKATAQPAFGVTNFKKLPFPLASTKTQNLIVGKIEELFSHIDAGVEGLKEAKAKLHQYRQSVLKDAVTGKLTEQWREQNADKLEPADKLLKRILNERRANWEAEQLKQFKEKDKIPKDDKWKANYAEPKAAVELDTLPVGWTSTVTDQVFSFVTSGSRGWAKYYSDEGPLFLRVGNLFHYNIELDLRKLQRVSPPKNSEGSRTRVQEGDNLISITADVGMVGYVPEGFEEAYINQHVALARPVQKVMGKYLSWLLSGDFAKEQFKALQKGATKAGLGLDDIKSISFGLPSILEQEKIVDEIEVKISGLDKLKKEIEQKLLHASKLKSSILADAFSGRLVENTDSNETAIQLLERIKAEKQLLEEKARLAKKKPNARAKKMKKRPIIEVLKASKNALKVEELFEQAGFQNDVSPEGVEAFYQELKVVAEDSRVVVSPIMLDGKKQGDKFKYREVKENEAG